MSGNEDRAAPPPLPAGQLGALSPEEFRAHARAVAEEAERCRSDLRRLLAHVAENPAAFGCASAREFAEERLRLGPLELEDLL